MPHYSNRPLVSVVTPSYNRAWIIQNCINSIRCQSYPNIEHIVVDGGSSDGIEAILEKNKPSYELRWIIEKDQGMYDAINKGIRMAKGEIIAYLNTDDFYFPYSVQLVVDYFDQHQDIEMVYSDWITYYVDSGFIEILPFAKYNKFDLAIYACLPQPTVFWRKSVMERVGLLDISYKLMADNEFFTRAAVSGIKIARIDDFLAGQTIHSDNLLAGNTLALDLSRQEAIHYRKRHYENIDKSSKKVHRDIFLARARSGLYSFSWRIRLIAFLLGSKFVKQKKWANFSKLLPFDSISWSTLFRYLTTSAKDRKRFTYCLSKDFHCCVSQFEQK